MKSSDFFNNFLCEYLQITRSFAIRYLSSIKEKSPPTQSFEQLQMQLSKILWPCMSGQLDSNVITKLLSLQLKGDYQQVLALTMLQDLSKLCRQQFDKSTLQQQPIQTLILPIFQTTISQSLSLLSSQQQFHTIVPKQNQLLRQLLTNPYMITNKTVDNYRVCYRKLKDVKEFYPQSVKEQQKLMFLKAVEESIQQIYKYEETKLIEFVFNNLLNELEVLDSVHQLVTSRLKIIKKIVNHLPFFHQGILYKSAFLITKFSKDILHLPHLFSSVVSLYEDLLKTLIKKTSPAPLIMFNHLVVNNIKKILQQKTCFIDILCLEILLNLLTKVFNAPYVMYFMKNYDCNFMQESICQQALNQLFEFVQNRANEKKTVYEIFKRQLKQATDNIRKFLSEKQPHIQQCSQKLLKFYEVKRKQYLQIVGEMNQKPKKIFKKLQSISNRQIREQIMKKYARIAKKSSHLQMKKMIDLFAANNSTSEGLFAEYVKLLFLNLSKDANLQQFLRFFSSNFFLNGESQQILRVLDKITILYYNHQPNKVLTTSDATYTFANAIILLNSDLHNPQNEKKMSQQAFYKICKRINNGEDLPQQILSTTYHNIKRNKINTFRSKSLLYGISPNNFVLLCSRQEEQKLQYYDTEMRMLTDQNFYHFFMYDLLSGVIDQRETMKLEQLIQRFVYDDRTYECEVIQLVRKLKNKKPHTPLHAFEKILEWANFKNTKTSQKTLSYLWLAVNLLQSFPQYLPTNVICQLLIFTWRLRTQLRDDMYLRQHAQIKRVKKMLREYEKRQNRKSIMDMFSSFLSSKENDSQPQVMEELLVNGMKRMNYKTLTEKVLDVVVKTSTLSNIRAQQQRQQQQHRVNHRQKAIEFFIGYLRNDQQKLFEQFLSILYLIFHLLWQFDIHNRSLLPSEQKQIQSPTELNNSPLLTQRQSTSKWTSPMKSSLQLSTELTANDLGNNSLSSLEQTIEDLFYQLLGLKQSAITKRIENLKKKDVKKYQILDNYCRYWVVRILINRIRVNAKDQQQGKENNQLYLLNKSIEFLQKTDKQTFVGLLFQFEAKVKELFNLAEKIDNIQKSQLMLGNGQQVKTEQAVKGEEEVNDGKMQNGGHSSKKVQEQNPQQNKQLNPQVPNSNLNQLTIPNTQPSTLPQQQHIQPFISHFIYDYRKIIQQFYVNCLRLMTKEEMSKDKKWRWIANLEAMVKHVMEEQADKLSKSCTIKKENNINSGKMNRQTQGNAQQNNKANSSSEIKQEVNNNALEQNEQTISNVKEQPPHPKLQKFDIKDQQDELMQKISQQLQQKQVKQQHNEPGNNEQTNTKQYNQQLPIEVSQSKNQQPKDVAPQQEQQNEKHQPIVPQQQVKQIRPQEELKVNININDNKNQQSPQKQTVQDNTTRIVQNTKQDLIKQEQEALKKLQQLYSYDNQSPEIPNIPFYMF